MVDAAVNKMTGYESYNSVCKPAFCLPGAIQLLTPCTIGNGLLKIVNTGSFTITLVEKKRRWYSH